MDLSHAGYKTAFAAPDLQSQLLAGEPFLPVPSATFHSVIDKHACRNNLRQCFFDPGLLP